MFGSSDWLFWTQRCQRPTATQSLSRSLMRIGIASFHSFCVVRKGQVHRFAFGYTQ